MKKILLIGQVAELARDLENSHTKTRVQWAAEMSDRSTYRDVLSAVDEDANESKSSDEENDSRPSGSGSTFGLDDAQKVRIEKYLGEFEEPWTPEQKIVSEALSRLDVVER